MRVGEAILRAYLGSRERASGRSGSPADYHRWQCESSGPMFASFPDFDFRGKRILELGCGLGGRSLWLADHGAGEVIGIDINAEEIEKANELKSTNSRAPTNLTYYPCRENERLEQLGEFDIVLFLDSLEHVVSPMKIIRMAREYARPGGKVYFTTIGWFHHDGSHTGIPFATLLFSDESILNALRWQMQQPTYKASMWDSTPPVARWECIYDLRDRPGEYLNKITIRQMRKLMKYAPFRKSRLVIQGFRNPKVKWLNPLRHVPLLNEAFHSAVLGVLEK